jgi:hypothetical protein
MTKRKHAITPSQALDNLFFVIKQAAESDPAFCGRLLNAVTQPVEFIGKDAIKAMDPCILAARKSFDEFKETLGGFTEVELRKLAKDNKFATNEQLEKVKKEKEKKEKYVELIWSGAQRQLEARSAPARGASARA